MATYKPKKPIEPLYADFPKSIIPNGTNYLGEQLFYRIGFVDAYKKYREDLEKYEIELEICEQIKLIKRIKNSTEKYCLKTFKILKK